MVIPVTNIRPGISWIKNFPVHTFPGNSIWIKSINCHGIKKLSNNIFCVSRIRHTQRFPVLENITPVSFVIKDTVFVCISNFNRESVPWTARIPMTTREN